MAIKYTTAELTRFRCDADCYGHAGNGYVKKGEVIEVEAGTPISQTWTEVDEEGAPVPGGHKSKKISRIVERPKGDEDKSISELSEQGEDAGDEPEAAPTPPAAPKPAKKPAAPKPAKKS